MTLAITLQIVGAVAFVVAVAVIANVAVALLFAGVIVFIAGLAREGIDVRE